MRKSSWEPHLTQCRPDRSLPPYQVTTWSIHLFGHNKHGPKSGGGCCATFGAGKLSPHLTLRQCGLGWGLSPYQVASWSIQPFSRNTPTLQDSHRHTDRQTDRQTDNGPIAPQNERHFYRTWMWVWHLHWQEYAATKDYRSAVSIIFAATAGIVTSELLRSGHFLGATRWLEVAVIHVRTLVV